MMIIYIFVFRISPFQHLDSHKFRNPFIMSQEIEKPFRIVLMRFPYLGSTIIVGFGIIPVHTYHIGRDTAAIVYIGFGIGHPTPNKIIIYRLSRRDCMQSQNQFIPGRIVVIWPGDRYHIIRIIGKTNSEIIGLYFFIACSNRLQYIVTDTPNQSARRISRNHIRVYRIPKLMASHHLNTIIRLSIHRVIFSSHSIGNPGMSH